MSTRPKTSQRPPHELLLCATSSGYDRATPRKLLSPVMGKASPIRIEVEEATVFPIERVLAPTMGLGHAFVGAVRSEDSGIGQRVLGVLPRGGAVTPRLWCRRDQVVPISAHRNSIELMGLAVPRLWARSAVARIRPGQAVAVKMERCDACFELLRMARQLGTLVTAFAVDSLVESCYEAGAHSVRLLEERPTIGEQEFDHVFDFGGSVSLRRARSILAEDGQYWTANRGHINRLRRLQGQFFLGRRYRLLTPLRTPWADQDFDPEPNRELMTPHRIYTVAEAAEVLRDLGGIPPWRMVVQLA